MGAADEDADDEHPTVEVKKPKKAAKRKPAARAKAGKTLPPPPDIESEDHEDMQEKLIEAELEKNGIDVALFAAGTGTGDSASMTRSGMMIEASSTAPAAGAFVSLTVLHGTNYIRLTVARVEHPTHRQRQRGPAVDLARSEAEFTLELALKHQVQQTCSLTRTCSAAFECGKS